MRPYIKFTSRNIKKSGDFYLAIHLGGEWFAANFPKIAGFSKDFQFERYTGNVPYILGFANVNSEIIPVIDLKNKIGMNKTSFKNSGKIIIFETEVYFNTLKFAIFYDTIGDAFEISAKHILPTPNIGNHFVSGNVKGMYIFEEKCIMLLNLDKAITIDDLIDIKVSVNKVNNELIINK